MTTKAPAQESTIMVRPNPIVVPGYSRLGIGTVQWSSAGSDSVEVRVGAPDGLLLSRSGRWGSAVTGKWVYDGMNFFLQDVSAGRPLTAEHTIATATASVVSTGKSRSACDRRSRIIEGALGRMKAFLRRKHYEPPVGAVLFGDLRRLMPISRSWGVDRGLPVDRYYVENFLAGHATDIRGHVLAVGNDLYARMFGGGRVVKTEVINLHGGDVSTTIVGDLTNAPHIPSNTFDCIVCPQTLQYIYDVRAAIGTLHRILKPGGTLLATVSGISKTADNDWEDYWCWNFTPLSVSKLSLEFFPRGQLKVSGFGNVLVAVAFLHGLSAEELFREELDCYHVGYEIVIGFRAVKTASPGTGNEDAGQLSNANSY